MSTMLESWPDPDPEEIRVRLRAHMGIYKISRSRLAVASGISRGALSTKLDGPVEFTVPEIVAVAKALGKSWLWVMTGDEAGVAPNPPYDGASRSAGATDGSLNPPGPVDDQPSGLATAA